MSFQDAFKKKVKRTDDWWSSGWGSNHDKPNPFVVVARRIKQDVTETVDDLKDEPEEVPYRIRRRLKDYQGMLKDYTPRQP